MLTLESGSLCDVCADEYSPRNLPHSIPCGHVLCLSCCTSIIEKTSKTPLCPFCREQFSRSSVRKIRIDFPGSVSSSGFSTPRRSPRSPRAPLVEDDFPHDLLLKVNASAAAAVTHDDVDRRIHDARRLETRVLKVASQKTSVEEVTTLQRELNEWLGADKSHSEMSTSLYLSALLLRAIISNHFAFSEAAKVAKSAETTLRQRVDELERERSRLDAEVHRLTHQLLQKASDGQTARGPFRATSLSPSTSTSRPSPPTSPPSTRVSSPTSQVTAPQPPAISRLTHGHYRSASVAPPSRTATPAAVPLRSMTPAVSSTPSYHHHPPPPHHQPTSPSHIPLRSQTPVPHAYRSNASTPSPAMRKIGRTMSISAGASGGAVGAEHARWIPDPKAAADATRPLGPRVPISSRG